MTVFDMVVSLLYLVAIVANKHDSCHVCIRLNKSLNRLNTFELFYHL